jgi:hypothetical protein
MRKKEQENEQTDDKKKKQGEKVVRSELKPEKEDEKHIVMVI